MPAGGALAQLQTLGLKPNYKRATGSAGSSDTLQTVAPPDYHRNREGENSQQRSPTKRENIHSRA